MIFTARHHWCESIGSYVPEVVLERLLAHSITGYTFFYVLFVDYDGVIDRNTWILLRIRQLESGNFPILRGMYKILIPKLNMQNQNCLCTKCSGVY